MKFKKILLWQFFGHRIVKMTVRLHYLPFIELKYIFNGCNHKIVHQLEIVTKNK